MMSKTHRAVSLFSNCGAGDVGYAAAGFHFDVMAELDPRRLEVCLLNHPGAHGIAGDLRTTWPQVVDEYRRIANGAELSLLAACPPCQGMSSARSGRGKELDPDAGMKDSRNLLVTVISKVARELRPRTIVVENVQAFLTRRVRDPRTKAPTSAARWLIRALAQEYFAFPFLTDLADYGVPQTRKRTFLTFVRRSEPALVAMVDQGLSPYPTPTHARESGKAPVTVRAALQSFKLPPLDARCEATATSRIGKGLHAVPVWRDRRYDMVAAIPVHVGASAWENDRCARCRRRELNRDRAECGKCGFPLLRPILEESPGKFRLITGFRTSTYTRMASDAPAPAVTTASGHIGSNNTIHPFENRLLSTLECALLQTLPRTFKWGDALSRWGHTNIRAMIGEAVPPRFTRQHGLALRAVLDGGNLRPLYPVAGLRCSRPAKKLR